MARKPNKRSRDPDVPMRVVTLLPHEFRFLKWNTPGPSGTMGGYPQMENWVIETIDRDTLQIGLNPTRLERMMRYCKVRDGYGGGGPNSRLRAAFIPALRRIGIDLNPEWSIAALTRSP